jgi:hypothetical protein
MNLDVLRLAQDLWPRQAKRPASGISLILADLCAGMGRRPPAFGLIAP